MKNKILFLLASLITLMFGPGAGHLIIKEWKKAAIFISVSFALLIILSFSFVSAVGHETLEAVTTFQNIDKFKDIFAGFKEENSSTMLIFNILFAAIWAYSIYDLFKIMKHKDKE